MRLSVIIPVFNEVDRILSVLEKVHQSPYSPTEVIIVDDGSFDGTQQLLQDYHHPACKVFFHAHNQGKGAALRTGFQAVSDYIDVVLIQDADLEYDPNQYPELMAPFLEGKADVVYGSRFMGGQPHRVVYFWHMLGNRVLTFLSNILTNLNLTDMETGFKVFKKSLLDQLDLQENGFGIEPELTAQLARLHPKIYEVGIRYDGRTYAEGKKIRWTDGLYALWAILKHNTPLRHLTPKRRKIS